MFSRLLTQWLGKCWADVGAITFCYQEGLTPGPDTINDKLLTLGHSIIAATLITWSNGPETMVSRVSRWRICGGEGVRMTELVYFGCNSVKVVQ